LARLAQVLIHYSLKVRPDGEVIYRNGAFVI